MSTPYTKILKEKSIYACNCVLYARSKVPSLPHGLWTLNDKKKIINKKYPRAGWVAVISVGLPWGHVAVVRKRGKNHITIVEANYKTCRITERHDTEKNLKIVGYFKPKK